MCQLGYLLFRLPPTIPCIECDLLSLSGAEVEQRGQLSHLCLWEDFCPGELNEILFFCGVCATFNLCSERSFCRSGLLPETAGDRCMWKGQRARMIPICAFGSSPPYLPHIFVSWFLLSLSHSVVFVCVSWLKGFAVVYIASYLTLAIFPKWLVIFFLAFFFPVLFSFAFVNTLFCPTFVKKKKVESVFCPSHLNYASRVFAFVYGRSVPCSCYHVFCCVGIFKNFIIISSLMRQCLLGCVRTILEFASQ